MPGPSTAQEQGPEFAEILAKVKKAKENSEAARKPYIPRWREWYGLHRNYRRYAQAHQDAQTENDRDDVVNDGKREFGAELFIPYAYSVIESMTPRILMNNPRMKVKPKSSKLKSDRADAIKAAFEERQTDIDYSLKLHPVCRRGLKYGLGVGKTYWEVEGRNRPVQERARIPRLMAARLTGRPDPPDTEFVITSEGPTIEDVELEDFFWDPAAHDIKTSRYAIHRTWRDERYIRERVERGEWNEINLENLGSMGGESGRSEMLSERAKSSGLTGFDTNQGKFHEIWEYHDGEMVYTILNGSLVVQNKPSPFTHRELPFQIYRPTMQEGEFVGIGEIEPIVHLQYELNSMRSQRRDNATLVLQKAFMYAEGLVDPADLVIGPGKGIPVYGNPNDVLVPLNFGDIPNSSVTEEQALKADIELATGMSDTVAGGSGANNASAETATGIQLVQAAANVRVEMKTKLLSAEFIKKQTAQWLEQYRDKVQDKPLEVAVEGPSGYEFVTITAEDLDQVQAIIPEEDSTGPENKPQQRNDALALYNQTRGNDVVDPRMAIKHLLRSFDVPDAEDWVLPEQTQMNPQVAAVVGQTLHQTLIEAGLDEEKASALTLAVVQRASQQTGISEPIGGDPAQNGAAPEGAPA